MSVRVGARGTAQLVVRDADTAVSLHSGDVEVLATPRVVGLCEEAAIAAIAGQLAPGETSVNARVELAHLAPSRVGATVAASATLERVEGRRLVFAVSVSDGCGLLAAGKLTRVVVERAHFTEKAR